MFDYDHSKLIPFKTDNLLELKNTLDDLLYKTPYSLKFTFLDEIEFNIIPEINISIETKKNTLNFLIDMNEYEIAMAKEKVKFLGKYLTDKRKYFQNRRTVNESKLDIITALLFDTHFVLELINQQIKQRDYKKYIIASNRIIFDNIKLQNYLTTFNETTPYLKNRIKEILSRIDKIIDFDNDIMQEINKETDRKDIHHFIDFGGGSFASMSYNYECIVIDENRKRHISLHSDENRFNFQSNYDYSILENRDFALKSNIILNTLTSYLNINSIEDFKVFLYGNEESKTTIDYLPEPKDEMQVEILNRYEHPEAFVGKSESKIILESTLSAIDVAFDGIDFADNMSYGNLRTVLAEYFTNGNIPHEFADIEFSRINRKKIGSKFNLLHKKFNKSIGLDFCKFCVININLWKTTSITDENRFRDARIYKDCHDNSF